MLIVGGTTSTGSVRTVGVCGRYWISSNTGVRRTTAPGRDREVRADLVGVGVDHRRHPRGAGQVAEQVPRTGDDVAAGGVDRRLPRHRADQRVVARRRRLDEVRCDERAPARRPSTPAGTSWTSPSTRLPGRKIGLHDATQHRVLRPRWVGEPLVPCGGRHLGRPDGDARQLSGEPAEPRGDPFRTPGQRAEESQAGRAGQEAPDRSEGRPGEQQVERRGRVDRSAASVVEVMPAPRQECGRRLRRSRRCAGSPTAGSPGG